MSFQSLNPHSDTRASVATLLLGLVAVAMIFLIIATPWAYGGVESWFRSSISRSLAVMAVGVGLATLLTPVRVRGRDLLVLMLPLTMLLGLGFLQWSGGVMSLEPLSEWPATTIYPHATLMSNAALLSVIAAAFVGAIAFRRDELFCGLLGGCIVSANIVAFFGIAMKLTGDDQIIRGVSVVGTPFANFVNRNNAASFMLLGVACGIALLASLIQERHRPESLANQMARRVGMDRQTLMIIVLILTGISLAGIVASASRGGIIASIVLVLVGLSLIGRAGQWRWVALIIPAIAMAAFLVSALGLLEHTIGRFQALSWDNVFSTGRIPHWIDATNAMEARPLLGAGLGTYGYAYQQYSEREAVGWFQHADNEYVELLVEVGLVGVALCGMGVFVIAGAILLGWKYPTECTLLSCLLAGQLTHACFDFGIVVPATSIAGATLASAGAMRLLSMRRLLANQRGTWLSRAIFSGVALVLAASLTWASQLQADSWEVEQQMLNPELIRGFGTMDREELDRRIADLSTTLETQPGQAEGHRMLGQMYVYRYRVKLTTRLRETTPGLTEAQAWEATQLTSLQRAINRIVDQFILPNLRPMREDELVQQELIPAYSHFQTAIAANPRITNVRVPLQALTFINRDVDVRDTSQAAIAAQLFPSDSLVMQAMGRMAWASRNEEIASLCWRNAFSVSGERFADVLREVMERRGAEEGLALIWPERSAVPQELGIEAARLEDERLRHLIADRLMEMSETLESKSQRERAALFAALLHGNEQTATSLREKILAESPSNTDVRVDFAQFLWSSGNTEQALDEIRQAIWIDPNCEDAQNLMGEWESQEKPSARER